MDAEERDTLVSEYLKHLKYQRMPVPMSREAMERDLAESKRRVETDPYFDAWVDLDYLCHNDPEAALSVILALIERCDKEDLGTLGAGPIESLVWKHARLLVDRLEHLLRTNSRFFEAYESVNMGGVPLTIQRRLNEILVEGGVPRESICEFPESYDFESGV